MRSLISILAGWKGYVLAGLLMLAAVWGYGRVQYARGVADTESATMLASAEQYKADITRINNSIGVLQAYLEDLQNAKPKVITEYRTRTVEVPLPADCHIDDGRLRTIQAGIERARAAGQSIGAMP